MFLYIWMFYFSRWKVWNSIVTNLRGIHGTGCYPPTRTINTTLDKYKSFLRSRTQDRLMTIVIKTNVKLSRILINKHSNMIIIVLVQKKQHNNIIILPMCGVCIKLVFTSKSTLYIYLLDLSVVSHSLAYMVFWYLVY